MAIETSGRIDKVNGNELSYEEFVERYMEKNQPVVLTGLMDDWKACSDWVDENGQPNLRFFSTHFGKSKVQVLNLCSIFISVLFCLVSFHHDALRFKFLVYPEILFSGIRRVLLLQLKQHEEGCISPRCLKINDLVVCTDCDIFWKLVNV